MTNIDIIVYHCTNPLCGLRFSAFAEDLRANRCPLCWQPTEVAGEAYARSAVDQDYVVAYDLHLEVLYDNIRSAWNVGSMLRSSDGAGVKHVHLGGVTPGAENPRVAKTSLGAESALQVSRHLNGLVFCKKWKDEGGAIWGLEGGDRAESLFSLSQAHLPQRLLLVAGNELTGVDPEILDLCDKVVFLPMVGFKGSLNVAVAYGIAVYTLRYGLSMNAFGKKRLR